jgi:tetraprenyl-beta-curcumene synthase
LVAYASSENCSVDLAQRVKKAYFPWVQGLHIMLDYFIDQTEDRIGGDLNFCSYYPSSEDLWTGLKYFYTRAEISVASLPDSGFHLLIIRGLVGMYLADPKVTQQKEVWKVADKMLQQSGSLSRIAFSYYRIQAVARRNNWGHLSKKVIVNKPQMTDWRSEI